MCNPFSSSAIDGQAVDEARARIAARSFGLLLCATVALAAGTGMSMAQQSGGAVMQACRGDVRSLCSGVQPGGGRIVACMKQNAAKLSDGCRKAVAEARSAQ